MAKHEDSYEEWLRGFTSSPFTSTQLEGIKGRPEATSAGEVKHLVEEVELLRFLLKSLLEYTEAREREHGWEAEQAEKLCPLLDVVRFMLSARE
jgi:hypothetical protein